MLKMSACAELARLDLRQHWTGTARPGYDGA